MKKLVLVTLLFLGGISTADPAAKAKCDPFTSMHDCNVVAQNDSRPPDPMPTPPPAAGKPTAAQLHQTCVDAMNADPDFAKSIVAISDKQIDQKTVEAHQDADFHIQKNERHVIYAYAAMWIIAAVFVIFLWRRQQALQAEIMQLRRDLDAAASDKPAEGRS